MKYVHRTIIVLAENVELARKLAMHLEPYSALDMFCCPLSETGNHPASHYASSGMIGECFQNIFENANALFYASNSGSDSIVSHEQCEKLLNSSDVSEDQPFDAFNRLGLVILPDIENNY